ncbi:MAG: DUF222 domain-containing protein [Propioniciclava sp.]|uniref:DUF222 domain-containing protein n=1 Tax=Propioniciclava sp. TaxID=2038686 RepID=UPI0039E4FAD8
MNDPQTAGWASPIHGADEVPLPSMRVPTAVLPTGVASGLRLGDRAGDVFDELSETVQLRSVLNARELVLVARACDEYEVTEHDLHDELPLDAALVHGTPADDRSAPLSGRVLAGERWIPGGAEGTPHVGEFLALELAGILRCTVTTAKLKIADALNLRHRHPRLWDAVVLDQRIEAWQAINVVRDTTSAGLSLDACLRVDADLAAAVGMLGWPRARRLLKGLILRADPELAAHKAAEARTRRGVWVDPIMDGVSRVHACLDGGDGVTLDAQIDRIAELLTTEGDTRDRQQRRATALAMLAHPHLAAAFLEDHALPTQEHAPARYEPPQYVPELSLTTPERPSDVQAPSPHTQESTQPEQGAPSAGLDAFKRVRRIDPDKLRPRVTLNLHLHADDVDPSNSRGTRVVRVEGHDPIDLGSLHQVLRGCQVVVRPVVDLNQPPATDAYEIPDRLREHVIARNMVEVFPWSARSSRGCQLDHTVPYRAVPTDAVPQTRAANLGPLSIPVHRAKTHADWRLDQPLPGVFHWRSPAGYRYLVTPAGTVPLGRDPDHRKTPNLDGRQAGNRPPPALSHRTPAATEQPTSVAREPSPPF